MANADLMKWVTSDVDFYELLGIAFENCSESELRRAYRKTALKYHPDKVGKNFDPAKYELFQAANSILGDDELKAKYDGHRQVKLKKKLDNDLLDSKRRQMKEALEKAEKAGGITTSSKRPREEPQQSDAQQALRKLAEEGRKRKAARASIMADSTASPVLPASAGSLKQPGVTPDAEDEVERLERVIREKKEEKEKRKAEKRFKRTGMFISPVASGTCTPIQRHEQSQKMSDRDKSVSTKASFSPIISTPKRDFATTMEMLKAAGKQNLEEEKRQEPKAV